MRIARVKFQGDLIVAMLRGHEMSELNSTWPKDAVIRNVEFDPVWGHVTFIVESSTFDDVQEGAVIPDWDPWYSRKVTLASEWLKVIKAGMEQEGTWPLT